MHQTHPVRHHPDIRWIVVVTMLITTATVLFVYTMWDITRPQPVLSLQVNRQAEYIAELQSSLTQMTSINKNLQLEVKTKNEELVKLQAAVLAAQAKSSVTSTAKTFPKN